MRLIDADELVAELIYLYEDRGWHEREIHFSLADMRCNVDIIPTVDSIKHGHWTDRAKSIIGVPTEACSECAEWSIGFDKDYCPNCGAKMDEV